MARSVLRDRSSSADLNVIAVALLKVTRRSIFRYDFLVQHYHAATSASRTNTISQRHFGLWADITRYPGQCELTVPFWNWLT